MEHNKVWLPGREGPGREGNVSPKTGSSQEHLLVLTALFGFLGKAALRSSAIREQSAENSLNYGGKKISERCCGRDYETRHGFYNGGTLHVDIYVGCN